MRTFRKIARNCFPERKYKTSREGVRWNKSSLLRTEGHGAGMGKPVGALRWAPRVGPDMGHPGFCWTWQRDLASLKNNRKCLEGCNKELLENGLLRGKREPEAQSTLVQMWASNLGRIWKPTTKGFIPYQWGIAIVLRICFNSLFQKLCVRSCGVYADVFW